MTQREEPFHKRLWKWFRHGEELYFSLSEEDVHFLQIVVGLLGILVAGILTMSYYNAKELTTADLSEILVLFLAALFIGSFALIVKALSPFEKEEKLNYQLLGQTIATAIVLALEERDKQRKEKGGEN